MAAELQGLTRMDARMDTIRHDGRGLSGHVGALAIGLAESGAIIYLDDVPTLICSWEWVEGWPCLGLQRELEDACGERDVREALYDAIERWRLDEAAERADAVAWWL